MSVPPVVRLPQVFDAAPLAAEARALPADAWDRHFNTAIYERDWSGVPLRIADNAPLALYPDPTATSFTDGPALAACPAVARVLASFPCPLQTVRFLRLGPGASIREHRDHALAATWGEVRLHVPLTVPPGVTFHLDGELVPMAAGECWYLDLTRLHRAHNPSDEPRVHLVIDAVVDEWLGEQLELGTEPQVASMVADRLQR